MALRDPCTNSQELAARLKDLKTFSRKLGFHSHKGMFCRGENTLRCNNGKVNVFAGQTEQGIPDATADFKKLEGVGHGFAAYGTSIARSVGASMSGKMAKACDDIACSVTVPLRSLIEGFSSGCHRRCPQPFRKVVGYGVVTLGKVNAADEPPVEGTAIVVAAAQPGTIGEASH